MQAQFGWEIVLQSLCLAQACAIGDVNAVSSILQTLGDRPPAVAVAIINIPHSEGVIVKSSLSSLPSPYNEATHTSPDDDDTHGTAIVGGHTSVVRVLVADGRCDVNASLYDWDCDVVRAVMDKLDPVYLSSGWCSSRSTLTPIIELLASDSYIHIYQIYVNNLSSNHRQQLAADTYDGGQESALELIKILTSAGPVELKGPKKGIEHQDNLSLNIVRLRCPEEDFSSCLPILKKALQSNLPLVVKFLLTEGAGHLFWRRNNRGTLEPQSQNFDDLVQFSRVSVKGCNPVHVACYLNSLPLVKMLLSLRVSDVTTNTRDWRSWEECNQSLYEANGRANSHYFDTPFAIAFEKGGVELVDYLLSLTADGDSPSCVDVNEQIRGGYSPIHSVSRGGRPLAMLKTLLQHGADVNRRVVEDPSVQYSAAPSYDMWTPLHFAAQFRDFEIIELLADNGADLDVDAYAGTRRPKFTPKDCISDNHFKKRFADLAS